MLTGAPEIVWKKVKSIWFVCNWLCEHPIKRMFHQIPLEFVSYMFNSFEWYVMSVLLVQLYLARFNWAMGIWRCHNKSKIVMIVGYTEWDQLLKVWDIGRFLYTSSYPFSCQLDWDLIAPTWGNPNYSSFGFAGSMVYRFDITGSQAFFFCLMHIVQENPVSILIHVFFWVLGRVWWRQIMYWGWGAC